MRKKLKPLHEFYPSKREVCYESVSSFKYPFTTMSDLMMLRFSPFVAWCTDALQIMRLYEMAYVVVRTVDDVADEGDSLEGEKYLSEILDFLQTDRDPKTDNEHLLQHICDVGQTLGRNVDTLQEAFINIFSCVYGDAQRRTSARKGDVVIRSEQEIESYVRQMELEGIFALLFEIFGEEHTKLESFWSLVKAGRLHFYLLRDVVEDVAEGLINIPQEYVKDEKEMIRIAQELERVKDISMSERLKKIKEFTDQVPELQEWVRDMVVTGKKELQKHKKQKLTLRFRTRMLVWGSSRRTSIFFEKASNVLLK